MTGDTRPTHMVRPNAAGKLVPICGAKRGRRGNGGDGLPCVAVEHAQAHIDGWGMVPCPGCVTALRSPSQLTLEVAS